MKITFTNPEPQNLDKAYKATNSTQNNSISGSNTGVKIDKAEKPYSTYEAGTRSLKDTVDKLAAGDVATMQDAMTVMSHTMSEKDYAKAVKDGVDMGDLNVSDGITILDKIKVAVAQGGSDIAGFTDTLNDNEIKEIAGYRADIEGNRDNYDIDISNDTYKEIDKAYEEISKVSKMTDGMKKYFLQNNEELTIDNLFIASKSVTENIRTGNGYFSMDAHGYLGIKSEITEADNLTNQIISLLTNLGVEATDTNIEYGRWLIDNSLYVTKENINRLSEINKAKLPVSDEEFAKSVLTALSLGKEPGEAVLGETEDIVTKASKMTDMLTKADFSNIHNRLVLEETRLKMTLEANLKLLRSDYSIDTKEIEEIVEAFKKLETEVSYNEAVEISKVSKAVSDISDAPVEFVGRFAFSLKDADLDTLRNEAVSVSITYDKAMETYEKVGTDVRADYGDSMKKAFRNVDTLIEETGLEVTDLNRRAVRILGYNRMDITRDNILTVTASDRKLERVLEKLSPQDTLNLIRSKKSPLSMSIDELSEYIEERNNSEEADIEKYSKFLYKLEKNNDITVEEREEFINVYRLFFMIKRGDYQALGSLINEGRELTLSNLRNAVKTPGHKGMDIKIDDNFGFLVSDLIDETTPDKLKRVSFDGDTTLTTLYDDLTKVPEDEIYSKELISENYKEYRDAMNVPEATVNELLMSKLPVTANNLLAANELLFNAAAGFKKIKDISKDKFEDREKEIKNLPLLRDEAAGKVFEMADELKEDVYRQAIESDSYIDVKALNLIHKELSLVSRFATEENYYVPVTINNETGSVHLKVVHNSYEKPNVRIMMESGYYGEVSAILYNDGDEINGLIACNLDESVEKLKKVADILGNNVSVTLSGNVKATEQFAKIPLRDNDETIDTRNLYETAKKFLNALN